MLRRIPLTILMALAAFAAPVTLSAQQAPAEVQALIREQQALEAKLQPLQQKALEDSALSAEQEEVGAAVRKAIVAANPALETSLVRFEAIVNEVRLAQEAGDAQKVGVLVTEARTIQPQIEAAQVQALEQPELSAKVAAFTHKVEARIVAIDPEARQLLDRRRELVQQIRKAIDGEGGGDGS